MDELFNSFLQLSDSSFHNADLLLEINRFLLENGCKCKTSETKSGYLVTYTLAKTKKSLANFVNRKSGVKIRIYPEHVAEYEDYLSTLPLKMKKEIKKASICKRLVNPDDCNSRCPMGYAFHLDGELLKRCRYSAFMPDVNTENQEFILGILKNELERS